MLFLGFIDRYVNHMYRLAEHSKLLEGSIKEMHRQYDEYNFLAILDKEPDMSKYQMMLPGEKHKYDIWNKTFIGGGSIF